MAYRIGINVGDVVVEGERIYDDRVNIAARIESLADGGGISVSSNVHEQVKNKLSFGFTSQGEQTVKNIADPVRVYKVALETPVAPPPTTTEELPTQLPFTNMSSDPEQEYFSDGITEAIITDLSKIAGLFVIARNSAFAYKDKAVNVQDVSRELGVRHILEGSIRRAGARVRIAAQFIDTTTGSHVWAECYDRQLEDIFDLQDEITQKIVFALKVTLTPEEQASFRRAPTISLEAYDAYLRGVEMLWRFTRETNSAARELLSEAIRLDPNYAAAYAQLGCAYWMAWIGQWADDPPAAMKQTADQAQCALALHDPLALGHRIVGIVSVFQREHEEARASLERAIALDPNDADHLVMYAAVVNFNGQPHEALAALERAKRLNPQFSGDRWSEQIPFHDPAYRTFLRDILRAVELQ